MDTRSSDTFLIYAYHQEDRPWQSWGHSTWLSSFHLQTPMLYLKGWMIIPCWYVSETPCFLPGAVGIERSNSSHTMDSGIWSWGIVRWWVICVLFVQVISTSRTVRWLFFLHCELDWILIEFTWSSCTRTSVSFKYFSHTAGYSDVILKVISSTYTILCTPSLVIRKNAERSFLLVNSFQTLVRRRVLSVHGTSTFSSHHLLES